MIIKNRTLTILPVVLCCCANLYSLDVIRIEAETCTEPSNAWQVNQLSPDRWNLWSTDRDAEKKWSGGTVFQSPVVKEDRASGEEGAPVLHTVVTNLPNGFYDVCIKGTRAIGISTNNSNWICSHGGTLFDEPVHIQNGRFELWVDDRYANKTGVGSCYYDYLEFRPVRQVEAPDPADFPPVNGWAKTRPEERLDRGVVALAASHGAYVSWRLLKTDSPDTAFDVYRSEGNSLPKKLNAAPITATTDFADETLPDNAGKTVYTVCPAGADVMTTGTSALLSRPGGDSSSAAYLSIKLQDPKMRVEKIAFADLNGDGKLDYILKGPSSGYVDPGYWKPSTDTYRIEAYLNDGSCLWTRDLGWSIERGPWYSPYLAADLNGDGKAEIAVKTGEGDPRDPDGRVTAGPEWLSIWDGMSGEEIAKAPWPNRDGFLDMDHAYNYFSRNQLAVAFLDGKTPCVIALRGTYNLMKADAWQLNNGQMEQLWSYNNERFGRKYRGQGAHFTHAADVDGDGRDEVMLGSVMLDDTGCPLWSTGLGHNDSGYISDILPDRPGLEIYYNVETRQPKNGMCLVDAKTGEIIWGYDQPTVHIHGNAMCADIDPLHPGMECWGADSANHKITAGPWLWSADGTVLAYEDPSLPKTFDINTVFWDADLQKEYLSGTFVKDFGGRSVLNVLEGQEVMEADIIGDWREEIITSMAGELRIYSTTIPAMDRRVCLMQDPVYRADLRMNSMGYRSLPVLSFCPSAEDPNVNLTILSAQDNTYSCRTVVSAPLKSGLSGTLSLTGHPSALEITLKPGEMKIFKTEIPKAAAVGKDFIMATLKTPEGRLCARTPVGLSEPSPEIYETSVPRIEAEDFISQGGGKVKIRTDKVYVSGQSISHWDKTGHWLEWRFTVPEAGRYQLIFRYATLGRALRKVMIDGQELGVLQFPATGGFGSYKGDWMEEEFSSFPAVQTLTLTAGEHTLRMTGVEGSPLNLDFTGYRKIQ